MGETRVARLRRIEPRGLSRVDVAQKRLHSVNSRHPPRPSDSRASFRAPVLKRAIKALQAVGFNPARVEIAPDGTIVIAAVTANGGADDSLDRWMARHAG